MARGSKTEGIRDNRKLKIKGDKSSGNIAHGTVIKVAGASMPMYGGSKIKEHSRMEMVKETKPYHISAVLVQSAPKPESRMTTIEKIDATRKGISKKEFELLKKRAGLDYSQLSYILQVARATLIAKKGAEKFSALLSEKIMGLTDIYSYGYEVFGSEEEFNKWIFQPVIALGGKSPYEILDNHYGREEVKHVIGRIEYGVYS